MAFTNVALVRQSGGFDQSDAHLIFWYADEPTLNTVVGQYISVAASWVKTRAGAAVYAAAALDADLTNLFQLGETYLALHWIFPILQSRRAQGSHYPLEQEGSERFEQLVGTQWMELASDLLEPYLTVEMEQKPFAMPVFILGQFVSQQPADPGGADAQDIIIEAILDTARAFPVGP